MLERMELRVKQVGMEAMLEVIHHVVALED